VTEKLNIFPQRFNDAHRPEWYSWSSLLIGFAGARLSVLTWDEGLGVEIGRRRQMPEATVHEGNK